MSRSRIFEEYARIADERGLVTPRVKKAEDDRGNDRPEVDMKRKEYSTRDTFKAKEMSSTEIFYGVKPNGEEKHIMEQSHPESVFIAPSYDKINGLVENEIERQKITINQILRPNTGIVNNTKLAAQAHQELIYELVRIANDLDIRGEDDLRALTDDCIEKVADGDLSKYWDRLKSWFGEKAEDTGDVAVGVGTGAAAGAVIGGVIGAIATIPIFEAGGFGPAAGATVGAWVGGASAGLIAAVAGTSPKAKNVSINSASAISSVDKVLKTTKHPLLTKLRADLVKLHTLADQYAQVSTPGAPTTVSEDQAHKITSEYIHQMASVKTDIKDFTNQANAGAFEDPDEGDLWSKIKTPIYNLINSKTTDISKELGALLRTIETAQAAMVSVQEHGQIEAKNQKEADQFATKINSPTAAPATPAAAPVPAAAKPSGVAAPQAAAPGKTEENLFSF